MKDDEWVDIKPEETGSDGGEWVDIKPEETGSEDSEWVDIKPEETGSEDGEWVDIKPSAAQPLKPGSPTWAAIKGGVGGFFEGAWAGGNAAANKIAKALPEVGIGLESAAGNAARFIGKGLKTVGAEKVGAAVESAGDGIVASAAGAKAWLDAKLPSEAKDWLGYEDWSTKASDWVGNAAAMAVKFAPGGAKVGGEAFMDAVLASDGANAFANTYDTAIAHGASEAEASELGGEAALINYFGGKALMKSGGWAAGIEGAGKQFLASGAASSATMAAQGAGNKMVENLAEGKPLMEGVAGEAGKGLVEGAMFHVYNAIPGYARGVVQSREARREYEAYIKDIILERAKTDQGAARLALYLDGPALDEAIRARKAGKKITRRMISDIGLPEVMTPDEAVGVIDVVSAQRRAWAERARTQMDDVQAQALAETVAQYAGEDKALFESTWLKVLEKIEDARELDDTARREELVQAAIGESAAGEAERSSAINTGNAEAGNGNAERGKAMDLLGKMDEGAMPVEDVAIGDVEGLAASDNGNVIEAYDAAKAKPIVVWEDLEGNRHAVTGGKRLAAAGASGAETVKAVVIKEADGRTEADGWTQAEARSIGAVENLKEGSGGLKNVVEAVDAIGADGVAEIAGWHQAYGSREAASMIRRGLAVAQKGGEELKAALAEGSIDESFAYNAAQVLSMERVGEGWEAAQRELAGLIGKVGPEELEAVLWGLKRQLSAKADRSDIDWKAAIAEERAKYNAKKGGAEGKLDSDQVLIETADGELKTLGEIEAESGKFSPTESPENKGEKAAVDESAEGGGKVGQTAEAPELAAAQGAGANRAVELRPVQGRDGVFGTLSHPKARFTVDGEGKVVYVEGLTPEDFAPEKAGQTAALVARIEAYAVGNGLKIGIGDEATLEAWRATRDRIKAEAEEAFLRRQAEERRSTVVERLKQSGLATEVVDTKGDFDRMLVELNGRPLTADEEVYGFCDTSTGKVYLNPDFFATRQALEAPIHEFGHLGIIAAEKVNKPVYDRGMKLAGELLESGLKPAAPIEKPAAPIKGGVAEIVDFILNDKYYSTRSRKEQAEELLAQLIGKRGTEALKNETNKTVVNRIKAWLVEFWNTFGKAMGLKDITPEQAEKMTVEEVADAIRAEMLSGRKYGEGLDRVEFGLAEGGSAVRIVTKPVRIKRKLTGRRKAVNEFVKRMGGGDDPANVETDLLALWVDNGGRLFDAMPYEISTGYSKGASGVKKTRRAVADEFAESTEFYRGLDAAQRRVFFGTGKLEPGSIGEGLKQRLAEAGITRFTNEDGTVDYEGLIDEFKRQWTNYERGEEVLKERNEWQEERDRAFVEEMERAEQAAYDEISAEEAAARAEMEAADEATAAQIAADLAAGRFSRGAAEGASAVGTVEAERLAFVDTPLSAKSYKEAREILRKKTGRKFTNAGSGLAASLSGNSINKILSGKAVAKSVGVKQHLAAAANIVELFEGGELRATEEGNRKGVKNAKRVFARFDLDGEKLVAKITVLEHERDDHRIYSVEAMEVSKAGSILAPKDSKSQAENPALPSTLGSIPQTGAGAQGGGLKPAAPRGARFSRSGIFTGTAADYANRSRQGGKDDGPSLKKIGTANGVAFGWGLYGSSAKSDAEGFGRNVVEQTFFTNRAPGDESHLIDWGKPLSEENRERILDGLVYRARHSENLKKAIERNLAEEARDFGLDQNEDYVPEEVEGMADDVLREAIERTIDVQTDRGESVYKHLAALLTGKTLGEVNNFKNRTEAYKAASEFLRDECDIDGIKYPAEADGAKAGETHYVAFSDKHIRVDHKWTDGKLRFSRAQLPNGRDFVHVDIEQEQFDGKTPIEQQKIAKRAILKKFRNKVIGEGDNKAWVDKASAGEYTHPVKRLNDQAYSAKMRTSTELDNLMATAKFKGHNPDDGRHPKAKGGWDHYEAIFEVGGRYYTGDVALMVDARGRRRLHDVTQIKEETLSQLTGSTQGHSAAPGISAREVLQGQNPDAGSSTGGIIPQTGAGAQGGVRWSRGGIFTGSGADYANRSRQGGVDDGPSLKKIGTGEGNQVYGWGLYGSTERGVAEGYANRGDSYGRDKYIKIDGKQFPINWESNKPKDLFYRYLLAANLDKSTFGSPKEAMRSRGLYAPYMEADREAYKKAWQFSKKHKISASADKHLYEQTFFTNRAEGDESHLLKWYEPVSEEQLKWIKDTATKEGTSLPALEETLEHIVKDGKDYGAYNHGEDIYDALTQDLGSPQAASEFLARAGIDGVKYPVDSYGKTVKDGDKAGWNYVAFSDENIRVDHKWTDGKLRFSRKGSQTGQEYTYAALTARPDMSVAQIEPDKFKNYKSDEQRVRDAKDSVLAAGGRRTDGAVVIKMDGSEVVVRARGIKHRGGKPNRENDMLYPVLGPVLKNAIPINELAPRSEEQGIKKNGKPGRDHNVKNTFVFLGAFGYGHEICPVRIQVVQKKKERSVESIDLLKSLNTKIGETWSPAAADLTSQGRLRVSPQISIANLIGIAQPLHPQIFSADVAASLNVPYQGNEINARFSRSGKSGEAELVKMTRVADDAGVGERTPGAIAASRELSRQGAVPLTTKGTRYVSLPLSEMNALARYLTGHAMPGEMQSGRKIGAAGKASLKERKLVIAADVLGTIDKSDMAAEKAVLKQHGYFAHEDAQWAANHSPQEMRAERERSEEALSSRLEGLADRRAQGKAPGGQAAARRVYADQLAKIVMAMPHGQPGALGAMQTVAGALEKRVRGNEGEAEAFLDWMEGGLKPAAPRSAQERKAEMFAAFLMMPKEMETRAKGWYDAIRSTIAADKKLAAAFREMTVRMMTEQGYGHLQAEILKAQDEQTEAAIRKLNAEAKEPIKAGDRRARAAEAIVLSCDDRMGAAMVRVDAATRNYMAAQKLLMKQAKTPQERALIKQQTDKFMGGIAQAKNQVELSRTAWERGHNNADARYLWRVVDILNEATVRDGLRTADLSLYMDMQRVIETKGLSGSRGMSARQAQIILDTMKKRLGGDYARIEAFAQKFHAIHEQELLNDPALERVLGKGAVEYWRSQTHYVTTKRQFSPEELAEIEAARRTVAAGGKSGGDTVIGQMFNYAGRPDATAKLKGSFADKQEVMSATLEKVAAIKKWVRRNNYVIELRDLLVAANVEGVHDFAAGKSEFPDNARYGSISYMENGQKRTLVVPSEIAHGFRRQSMYDNAALKLCAGVNNIARQLWIDWNPVYWQRNIARNAGSIEMNMPGMRESKIKRGLRFAFPGLAPVTEIAMTHLVRHMPEKWSLPIRKVWGEHTALFYAPKAKRMAMWLTDHNEMQRRLWEAEKRGDLGAIQEMEADRRDMLDALKGNMLVGISAGKASGTAGFLDESVKTVGRTMQHEIQDAAKKAKWRKALDAVNIFSKNAEQQVFEDVMAKFSAYLHDRAQFGKGNNRTAEESGLMVKKNVSIGEGERKGGAAGTVQALFQPFWNMVEKGVVRNVKAYGERTGETLEKAAWRIAPMILHGLIGSGAVAAWILKKNDGDEEKVKNGKFGEIYRYLRETQRAYQNCSNYVRENYHVTPLMTDGYTSVILGMPLTDEERLLKPIARFVTDAASVAAGTKQSMDVAGFMSDVYGTVAPDFKMAGAAVTLLDDTVGALIYNPDDYYTGGTKYDKDLHALRNENWGMRGQFLAAMGKRLWNDFGGRNVLPVDRAGVDNGLGKAPGWVAKMVNNIPLASPILRSFVKIQVGSPRRDAAEITEAEAKRRAIVRICSKEMFEAARREKRDLWLTPERYTGMLDKWQQAYGLSPDELAQIEAKYLNAWRAYEGAQYRADGEREKFRAKAEKLGLEAAGIWLDWD